MTSFVVVVVYFFVVVYRSESCTFLSACIIHRYFIEVCDPSCDYHVIVT